MLDRFNFRIVTIFATIILSFSACQVGMLEPKLTPNELFDKYKKGVVMIVHKFYYEIELNDGTKFYFTDIDEEGNYKLETQLDSAIYYANVITGTGFFIDNEGKIATNRHIVDPAVREKEEVVKSLLLKTNEFKGQCEDAINDIDSKIAQYGYHEELYKLRGVYIKLANFYSTIYNDLISGNVDLKDKIKCVSIHLGVGYDNTIVENYNDLKECAVIKVASDEETDLAIIQLKDKKTPEGVITLPLAEISAADVNSKSSTINKKSGWDEFKELMGGKGDNGMDMFGGKKKKQEDSKPTAKAVQITQPVYMLGYNAGFVLAKAKSGLSAQLTLGNINQTPDNNSIMYSIPCLPGSSGSPVLNDEGEVIAINFSKFAGSQGFANGIPVAKLVNLMK